MAYIDELFDEYFETVGSGFRNAFKPGQIVWTHFTYNFEHLEFWRPNNLDDSGTIASEFNIQSSPSDVFNKRIPLSQPRLEINEEFLVVRTKKRPGILVTLPPPEIEVATIRGGGKINLNLSLLAPLFSLEDSYGNAKYHSDFVNRTRKLLYPHLFFLPKKESSRLKDSLCRFDRIFAAYTNHMEPVDLCLKKDILGTFMSQFTCFVNEDSNGDYKTVFDLLNTYGKGKLKYTPNGK